MTTFTVPTNQLVDVLKMSKRVASKETTRPALMCVYIKVLRSSTTFATADGYRLYVRDLKNDKSLNTVGSRFVKNANTALVSAKHIPSMIKALNANKYQSYVECSIDNDSKQLVISTLSMADDTGGAPVGSYPLEDANFPDVFGLLKANNEHQANAPVFVIKQEILLPYLKGLIAAGIECVEFEYKAESDADRDIQLTGSLDTMESSLTVHNGLLTKTRANWINRPFIGAVNPAYLLDFVLSVDKFGEGNSVEIALMGNPKQTQKAPRVRVKVHQSARNLRSKEQYIVMPIYTQNSNLPPKHSMRRQPVAA